MRKFTILEALIASAAALAVFGYALADNKGAKEVSTFGLHSTNEYGCQGDCTAEYEIGHVYRLFEDKPAGYRVDGVRFKVKYANYVANYKWFQDTWDGGVHTTSRNVKANLGSLLMLGGREQGLTSFKEGDEVCFFAAVSKQWDPWGIQKVLYAENPVYYRVNAKADLSLLQSPVYIQ